jgi:excisionase family DNA binding protein
MLTTKQLPLPAVFTPDEFGALLRCSRGTVRRMIAHGDIKTVSLRVGARSLQRIPRTELDRILASAAASIEGSNNELPSYSPPHPPPFDFDAMLRRDQARAL